MPAQVVDAPWLPCPVLQGAAEVSGARHRRRDELCGLRAAAAWRLLRAHGCGCAGASTASFGSGLLEVVEGRCAPPVHFSAFGTSNMQVPGRFLATGAECHEQPRG